MKGIKRYTGDRLWIILLALLVTALACDPPIAQLLAVFVATGSALKWISMQGREERGQQ